MSQGRRRKVLIADDDAEVRDTIGGCLHEQGFEVVEAANGLESLLQVKRERPDAVLLDAVMPRLGALDVLKRIRAFDPGINVIVITNGDDPLMKQQALALGAMLVLQKPLDQSILIAALRLCKS